MTDAEPPRTRWYQRTPRWLTKIWHMLNVDVDGAYSLARLLQFQQFMAAGRPTSSGSTSTHQRRQRLIDNAAALLLPMLSLAITLILECIPLQAPSGGIAHNMGFSLRCIATVTVYTTCILVEARACVLRKSLPLSNTTIAVVSLAVAVLDIAVQYGVATAWAFPIPFTQLVMMPPWLSLMAFCTWVALIWHRSRTPSHHNPQPSRRRQLLVKMAQVISIQAEGSFLYPIYYYLFLSLGDRELHVAQFFVSLLLPALKLMQKKRLMAVTTHIRDLQPLFMALNPELFSALFTLGCMQNSGSIATTVILMLMDFAHACYSLFDIHRTGVELDILIRKLGGSRAHLVDVAAFIVSNDPAYRQQTIVNSQVRSSECRRLNQTVAGTYRNVLALPVTSKARSRRRFSIHLSLDQFRRFSSQPSLASVVPNPSLARLTSSLADSSLHHLQHLPMRKSPSLNAANPSGMIKSWSRRVSSLITRRGMNAGRVAPMIPMNSHTTTRVRPSAANSNAIRITQADAAQSIAIDISALTTEERGRLVHGTLRLLRVVETLLLIEYIEVLIPIGYFCYLHVMYLLPNRAYYPRLRTLDDARLASISWNLVLFGALQLLSFMMLRATLSKRLQLAPGAQLAFALRYKRELVACMLTLWIIVTLQSSVEHLGHDYSFSFAWLHKWNRSSISKLVGR